MRILDKTFEPFIEAKEIEKCISRMASKINEDYRDKDPLFISILNGSFMFTADLLKKVTLPSQVTFVRVVSYDGTESSGAVKEVFGLETDIKGRHIILIDDIVDSGKTLQHLWHQLEMSEPKSLAVAALLHKPEAYRYTLPLKYTGFEIENKFVIGYGLDYDGYGRNLGDIYQISS